MKDMTKFRFSRDDLELKPGHVSGQSALCLVYADTRAYQDALDSFGIVWGTTVQAVGPKAAIVALTIDGITRSASGEDTDLMSAEARAFKRACSAFGLGRYLYSIDVGFQPFDGKRFSQAAWQAVYKAVAALDAPERTQGTPAVDNTTSTPKRPQKPATQPTGDADDLDKLHKHFHALGKELYSDAWDTVRKKNVKRVSGGRTDSSTELTPDEVQALIDGMNIVRKQRQAA